MKTYFIFTPLSEARNAPLVSVKTFREPLYSILSRGVATCGGSYLMQGLFICRCFLSTIALNSNDHGSQDKGSCKRCTLIQKIIGSGKLACQPEIGLCSQLLTQSRDDRRSAKRRTFKGFKWSKSLPFCPTLRGKDRKGVTNFIASTQPLAHSAGCRLNSSI